MVDNINSKAAVRMFFKIDVLENLAIITGKYNMCITSKEISLFYNTSARHEQVRQEWDTSATQVKIYFQTPILAIWQMKDYKKRNNFILRTRLLL